MHFGEKKLSQLMKILERHIFLEKSILQMTSEEIAEVKRKDCRDLKEENPKLKN